LVVNLLLTVEEVATVLRVSERTVKDLASEERLPGAVKVGKVWRFSRTALEQMLGVELPKVDDRGAHA
jgi:excisionase family DNA binding protein